MGTRHEQGCKINDTSWVGKNPLQSMGDFRSAPKEAPTQRPVYKELYKLTFRRRAYRNMANTPSAMQAVKVTWPYTCSSLLPTEVGMTCTLGSGVNE